MDPWGRLGCREDPFRAGFDERFIYLGHAQQELLGGLERDVASPRGLSLVIGPTGTGKTTLLRKLVAKMRTQGSLVFHFATPAPVPTLAAMASASRAQAGLRDDRQSEDIDPLVAFRGLLASVGQGQRPVLIVDEAQSSRDQLIEDLIALAAPAPEGTSLLPIILAGQPLLALRLARMSLAKLGVSIGHRYALGTLASSDVAAFIRYRLRQAGCTHTMPFTREAIDQISSYAQGVPGSINTLCRLAVFFAAEKGEDRITADSVELAASGALLSTEPLVQSKLNLAPTSHAGSPPQARDWKRLQPKLAVAGAGNRRKAASPRSQRTGSGEAGAFTFETQTDSEPESGQTDWAPVRTEPARCSSHPARGAFTWAAALVVFVLGSAAMVPLVQEPHSVLAARFAPWLVNGVDLKTHQSETSRAGRTAAGHHGKQIGEPAQAKQAGIAFGPHASADESPWISSSGAAPGPVAAQSDAAYREAPEEEGESAPSSPEQLSALGGSNLATEEQTEGDFGAAVVVARENVLPPVAQQEVPSIVMDASLDAADTPNPPGESIGAMTTGEGSESEPRSEHPTGARATASDLSETSSVPLFLQYQSKDREAPPSSEQGAPRPLERALPPPQRSRTTVADAELDRLLALGRQYVESDRLVAPRFDNALTVYGGILRADPWNSAALEGLAAIRERLMSHARAEEARGDLESARRQLSKLKLVDAEYQAATGQSRIAPMFGNDLGMSVPDPNPPGAQEHP
jgi:type II secretory pathway predicted ATPase ExeA